MRREILQNKGFTIFGLLNIITILIIVIVLFIGIWGRFTQSNNLEGATKLIKMSVLKALNSSKELDDKYFGVFLEEKVGREVKIYSREKVDKENYETKIFDEKDYKSLSLPAGTRINKIFILNNTSNEKYAINEGGVSVVFSGSGKKIELIDKEGLINIENEEVLVIEVSSFSVVQYVIIDTNKSRIEIRDKE